MFEQIRNWLAAKSSPEAAAEIDPRRVAAAALLVEAAHLDGNYGPEEQLVIVECLANRFGLQPAAAKALARAGEEAQSGAVDLFGFTRRAAEGLTEAERVELVEMLWEVVYADGAEHHYESNLIRRVAGLLHVPDRLSGEARQRVLARRAVGQGE